MTTVAPYVLKLLHKLKESYNVVILFAVSVFRLGQRLKILVPPVDNSLTR